MDGQIRIVEKIGIFITELAAATVTYFLAVYFRFGSVSGSDHTRTYLLMYVWMLLYIVCYDIWVANYKKFLHRGYMVELGEVIRHLAGMLIYLGCSLFLFKEAVHFSRLVLAYFLCLYGICIYFLHLGWKRILRNYLREEKHLCKVLVIAESENSEEIIAHLLKYARYEYEIVGAVIWDISMAGQKIHGIQVIANRDTAVETCKGIAIDDVFIYLPNAAWNQVEPVITDFEIMGVACRYCMGDALFQSKSAHIEEFARLSVATYTINSVDYRQAFIKRLIDIVGSLAGLLITGILYPFIVLAIKLDSPGPAVFSQVRIGKNGRRFKIYKFRSMYIDAEERKKELMAQNQVKGLMFKMDNDPRITPVGRFLRKTSLDELPQFYNIFKGDMSLVGTRPPTVDEFEQYTPYYRRRLCMTPGLTGLWQVSGRSEIEDFDEVVKLDLQYIDKWSVWLDIKILFETVGVVLFKKGAK